MSDPAFRQIPSVTQVLAAAPAADALGNFTHAQVVQAIRAELDQLRQRVRRGESLDGLTTPERLAQAALGRLRRELAPRLRLVVNATGIVLHTNLGRAPLAEAAVRAVQETAGAYLDLELDLATGKRSSRQDSVREWLCRLTGAGSATVVNNNAAATVIVLRAIAQGKEVILSRGQLIEIGGSFRIPEIMGVSGAILREVGTTNITRLSDFARAIGPQTGALMQIHCSNYRVRGFTKSVPLTELVELGRKHSLPVVDDAGSGALLDFARFGFEGEPIIRESIRAGADLVLFSGDKLLGGPQAGIIVGKPELIQKIEKDPLMRAFRCDKMTLAALEATLRLYLNEEQALSEVPVLRMLSLLLSELRQRAERLAVQMREVPGVELVKVSEDEAFVGGGSLPDQAMKTVVLEVLPQSMSDEELARRLRLGRPAVLARLRDGRLVLDLRTVFPEQETQLLAALRQALSAEDHR